jgi:hypothetical protein
MRKRGHGKGFNEGWEKSQGYSEKAFQDMIEGNKKYFGLGD